MHNVHYPPTDRLRKRPTRGNDKRRGAKRTPENPPPPPHQLGHEKQPIPQKRPTHPTRTMSTALSPVPHSTALRASCCCIRVDHCRVAGVGDQAPWRLQLLLCLEWMIGGVGLFAYAFVAKQPMTAQSHGALTVAMAP